MSDIIRTSSFFHYDGDNGISIALSAPDTFRGPSYRVLFPTRNLLYNYRKNLDVGIYEATFKEEVLDLLKPEVVFGDLKGKTLLCWEEPGAFCHRRLVAKWLHDELGIEVVESNKD